MTQTYQERLKDLSDPVVAKEFLSHDLMERITQYHRLATDLLKEVEETQRLRDDNRRLEDALRGLLRSDDTLLARNKTLEREVEMLQSRLSKANEVVSAFAKATGHLNVGRTISDVTDAWVVLKEYEALIREQDVG